MSWEQETLTTLRIETEKRLKELRCNEEWTLDGPWQMVVEMTNGAPAVLLMPEQSEPEESAHADDDENGKREEEEEEEKHVPESIAESDESDEEEEEEDMSWADTLLLFRWNSLGIMQIAYNMEAMQSEERGEYKLLNTESLCKVIVRAAEDCFSIVSISESYITEAIKGYHSKKELYNFRDFVSICHESIQNYQNNHHASGFDLDEKSEIQKCFDSFAVGDGLKLEHAFSVLQALGVPCATVPDQQSIIALRHGDESNKSGVMTFGNFLHWYRRILRSRHCRDRVSEISIIKNSGFSNEEIQGFRVIFDAAAPPDATDAWTGIEIQKTIGLLHNAGVKFSREDKITVLKWIKLVDDDNNGVLNFGEFCALMSLIWHTNLGGCRELKKKEASKNARTRKGSVVASESNLSSELESTKEGLDKAVTVTEDDAPISWVTLLIEQHRDAEKIESIVTGVEQPRASFRARCARRMSARFQNIADGIDDPDENSKQVLKQRAATFTISESPRFSQESIKNI
eukprot:GEMP01020793.1.p1 GENE.GEMP01020793.1~~GEMP01020793.1.p1  ORF type:complete len:516 (+),score=108.00 GEMP01020793.1:74-1621(+)